MQYVLNTSLRKQTQITQIRHEPSYKQLEVKTNRTSFLCENGSKLVFAVFMTIYFPFTIYRGISFPIGFKTSMGFVI